MNDPTYIYSAAPLPIANHNQRKIFKTNSLPVISHLKKNKLQGLGQQTDSLGGTTLFYLPAHDLIHICALRAHPLYEDTISPIILTPTGADPGVQYSGGSCCSNPGMVTPLSAHHHRTTREW